MHYLFTGLCFLCGSIPFGLLLGFMAGKDVRKEGSGNIGFTNVLRVCGKSWGIPVLILDAAKGFLPVYFLPELLLSGDNNIDFYRAIGGVCAVLGHNFTPWLKFRGGKGVATGAGVLAALVPQPFLIGLGVWIVLVAIFRYVSLGSMFGAFVVFAVRCYFTRDDFFSLNNLPATLMAFLIWALVMVSHRANIKRLLNGQENKIGAKKKTDTRGAPAQ